MTAVTDFTPPNAAISAPARLLDGGRAMARAGRKVTGAALLLAALGLWLTPGADWATDLMLFKLMVSLASGFVGLALIQNWDAPQSPEVEIDVVRRKVRLVRRVRGTSEIVQEYTFAELHHAQSTDATAVLWGSEGEIIAEVAPSDRDAFRALQAGLRDAGKL